MVKLIIAEETILIVNDEAIVIKLPENLPNKNKTSAIAVRIFHLCRSSKIENLQYMDKIISPNNISDIITLIGGSGIDDK